jgi:hypothetical protein
LGDDVYFIIEPIRKITTTDTIPLENAPLKSAGQAGQADTTEKKKNAEIWKKYALQARLCTRFRILRIDA